MSLDQLVNVQIGLQTSGVSRAGFGTPLFIGAHRYTLGRTATFTSLESAASVIPTGTPEYTALTRFFSQSPRPASVKIGRRNADITLEFMEVDEGEVYSIAVSDGITTVLATHTVAVSETAEDIADALVLAIDSDPDVSAVVSATVVGSGTEATVSLVPANPGDNFIITDASENITVIADENEDIVDAFLNISQEDSDFYFVTSHDHDPEAIEDLAEAVEATSRMYLFSTDDAGSLTPRTDSSSDILATVQNNNNFRTFGIFHDLADVAYPECAMAGKVAPSQPGTITWSHKQLAGVPVSRNPNTGNPLTETELNNLAARNANFIYNVGGLNIVREGKVAGGEWADIIRSRDLLVARITEAYQNFLINSPKVPYTDSGINAARGVIESVLTRYITTDTQPNILDEGNPFSTNFPRAADVPFGDKQARILNASFTAFLAGAIHVINITGTLTYDAQA